MNDLVDVFVSYGRADRRLALEVVDALRSAGLTVWWDRDLPQGGRFREDIFEAVERARSIIVLWSEASIASPWVAQEALIGLDRGVLIPLTIGTPVVPPGLGAVQAMPLPAAQEERSAFLGQFAVALIGILEGRETRSRRGLAVDVTRYNRLSLLRMLAWSLLLGALASAAALVVSYGSADMDNAIIDVGLPTVGFLFVARWAVGASKTRIFVAPEPFFSKRMLVLVLVILLVEIIAAAAYDDVARRNAGPGGIPDLSLQGRMLFVARSLSGAAAVGLICAPLIRAGFAASAALGRFRRRRAPSPANAGPNGQEGESAKTARRDGAATRSWQTSFSTRLLLLTAVGVWLSVFLTAALIPNVSRLDARRLAAGAQFNDCGDGSWCPAMIVIPRGQALVGSSPAEAGHRPEEAPRHLATIPSLAVSKYEITISQWGACVAEKGCSNNDPLSYRDREERRRANHPVANLEWSDAREYVRWLSRRTGQPYRLLSEAEWEHAARGGTRTPWPWGTNPGAFCTFANGADEERMKRVKSKGTAEILCNDGVGWDTAAVGRYRPNRFGLYDMLGNVEEWVEDCWNPSHAGASLTGAARRTGNCRRHVVKGGDYGGWTSGALRPASRKPQDPGPPLSVGLRVARELG